MRSFLPVSALVFGVACLASVIAVGAPSAKPMAEDKATPAIITSADVVLGKPVCGPEITGIDTKKALVVEYWGNICPPCLQTIPHLCEIQTKYGREKLIVIANHAPMMSERGEKEIESIKKAWDARAPKDYAVSVVCRARITNATMGPLPQAFVFGKDGKLVWSGHVPSKEFDQSVQTAVGE